MKNVVLAILALIVVALGAVCVVQRQAAQQSARQIAALQRSLAEQTTRLTSAEQRAQAGQRAQAESMNQSQQLRADLALASNRVAALETERLAAATNAAPSALRAMAAQRRAGLAAGGQDAAAEGNDGTRFMGALAKMMKSPEMQSMVREQMRTVFEPIYAPLIQELNLSAEDADAFKNLLIERQMAQLGPSMELQQGNKDDAQRKAALDAINSGKQNVNTMIHELLGDKAYERYQAYEQTEQERMSLNQFKQELSSGGASLDQTAQERLVQAMNEERLAAEKSKDNVKLEPGMGGKDLNEDMVAALTRQQAAIDSRVYDRAQSFLPKEQLEALKNFQEKQQRMRTAQLKMALTMFGKGTKAPGQ